MSTASTGAPWTSGAFRPVPARKPVPYAASITRSATGSTGGHAATSYILMRQPRAASHSAATRPSAPLLPVPATTLTVRP